MSRTLNKVQLIGRLGGAVELRYTSTGTPVATFSLATNTPTKNQDGSMGEVTDWHSLVAWNKLAETCNEYLRKGSLVYIEGRIQTRSWDDKETGQKKYMTEIVANDLVLLGGREPGAGGGEGGRSRSAGAETSAGGMDQRPAAPDDMAQTGGITDEDIPF